MKKSLLLFAGLSLSAIMSWAQSEKVPENGYRNFPIIVSLQFQNLATPFHDLKGNFSNVGILVGTEVSYNGKQNWVQQVQAGFFLNKNAGNGFMAFTQVVYRPTVFNYFYPEIKAGIGWQRAFHPVATYEFENGAWSEAVGGKSQLIIPLGVSFGYNKFKESTYLSPFISYQVLIASNYSDVIPLNFYSLIQFGTRIHLNYHSK